MNTLETVDRLVAKRRFVPALCVLTGILLAACEPVATPTLSPGIGGGVNEIIEPMQVNEVQIVDLEGDPGRPAAAVEGVIGDSCNQLDSESQSRDGNAISIQINVRRTLLPGQPCEELAQVYSQTVPLQGDFPPGDYTVVVNGKATTFAITQAARPTPTPKSDCLYDAEIVEDVQLPSDLSIAGGEPFPKVWRLRNTGTCLWDGSFNWVKIEGGTIAVEISSTETIIPDAVEVPATQPGEVVGVSAQLVLSLDAPLGSEQEARFQMQTPDGEPFGETGTVQVVVGEGGAPARCTSKSEFVEDINFPDGTRVPVGETFVKTWRIRNAGSCPWDDTYEFVQLRGDLIRPTIGSDPLPLTAILPPGITVVNPGDEVEISLELILSPDAEVDSEQEARFQIRDSDGEFFGTQPFVLVSVAPRQ